MRHLVDYHVEIEKWYQKLYNLNHIEKDELAE